MSIATPIGYPIAYPIGFLSGTVSGYVSLISCRVVSCHFLYSKTKSPRHRKAREQHPTDWNWR